MSRGEDVIDGVGTFEGVGAGEGVMQSAMFAELFTPAALTRAAAANDDTFPVLAMAAVQLMPGMLTHAVTAVAYVTAGTGAGGLRPTPRPTAIAMTARARATPNVPHLQAGAQAKPVAVVPNASVRGSTVNIMSRVRPPVGIICEGGFDCMCRTCNRRRREG